MHSRKPAVFCILERMVMVMSAKKYPEAEPTLYDVIELIQNGFAHIDNRFERVEGEMRGVKQEIRILTQRIFKVELRVEDIADAVHDYGKRIVMLERWKKNSSKTGLTGA